MSFVPVASPDPQRLEDARRLLCEVCNVPELHSFQDEAGQNMLKGFDTIVDAPTGAGKTLTFLYSYSITGDPCSLYLPNFFLFQ
ncbi:hypothetical protein F5146DRAFT_1034108 [Armillaria mellea]|nr:hypothetical protein F5146DRAFT_1034108 [Armillaria mellea]